MLKLHTVWDQVHFLLSVVQDVELSVLCLPACCLAFHCEDNRLNLWNCKLAPSKYFVLEVLL